MGVLLLTLSVAYPGIWALFSPRSFFLHFPGFGQEWTRAFPPYSEHLVRDVGSFFFAFAVLLGGAAVSAERRLIRFSLLGYLVFSIPHLIWHSQHATGASSVDKWGPVVALALGVVLSLAILVALRRRR